MARPRRQQERRAQLVAATTRAIADRGLAGLRLRHIAEQAELSVGSVLYYYPDLDSLLIEVHEQALERFFSDRVRATDTVSDPATKLVVAVSHGVPSDPSDPALRAIYELHAEASRNPVHAELLTTLWRREVSAYERILDDGSSDGTFRLSGTPRNIAETVVALEDAFDLHLTSGNRALSRTAAVGHIVAYLSLATGCELRPPSPR
ncbi:MAG: TetR/AcrR family transcriptional regulator [Actinomycetes bacterium]